MSWKGRNTNFDPEPRGPTFPYIQWVNNGASLEPRRPLGGFFQPAEQVEALGVSIPGEASKLYVKGKQVEGVFNDQLEVAAICSRFGWKTNAGDFAVGKRPGDDWHGKIQVLALVRDATGKVVGPVVLTFTGWAGTYFQEACKQHRENVDAHPESKSSPPWLFFGCYQSDRIEMVGKDEKSPVTRIAYCNGFDPNAAYIGDEAADRIEAMKNEIEAWKSAWDSGGNGNGSAGVTPQPKDPNKPASDAQWHVIRRLLADLGYTEAEDQKAAMRKAGFDPDNLTMDKASEVINRLQAKANGK